MLLSPPVSLDKRSFAPHCPFASRCINKYQQHTAGGNPALDSHPIHFFMGRGGGGGVVRESRNTRKCSMLGNRKRVMSSGRVDLMARMRL